MNPFIGTIQLFSFPFAPKGWALCNGQLMPISTNQALFSLLGTAYGGDGIRTFALPDLRGRTPISFSMQNVNLGQVGGEEQHTLSTAEMAAHNHALMTDAATPGASNSNVPTSTSVLGQSLAKAGTDYKITIYRNGVNPNNALATVSLGLTGNSVGHENRMPLLVMNFCIALVGIFPSRS